MSRITFFSITLATLGSLLITALVSPTANAWAPIESPEYTFDISAAFTAQTSGTPCENWESKNYAVFEYYPGNTTGTVIMGCFNDNDVLNNYDSGSGYISDQGTSTGIALAYICRWTFDGNTLFGCQTAYNGSAPNLYNLKLNQAWIDNNQAWLGNYDPLPPEYESGGGSGGNPLDPDNDVAPRCDAWDIACWFSNVVGNVIDGFQSLGDAIIGAFQSLGEWIANLIMPANEDGGFDNRFTGFFTDIGDTMNERLGFLLFPFEFFADLIASFTTIYNPYGTDTGCTSGSIVAIPNLLGDADVGLDLCGIEDTPVWQPASTLLRFVWIVGLVGLLHKKYMSTVRA